MTRSSEHLFQSVDCDMCGGREAAPFLRMKDPLYGVPGTFTIVRCSSCGLLYTNPRPGPDLMNRLYKEYYDDFQVPVKGSGATTVNSLKRNLKLRRVFHLWFGHFLARVLSSARGRVLDVGCGTGSLLEELVRLGCRAYGIEPNPNSAEACIKKGLNVRCGFLDDMDYPENFFDTVILWHVIEHLWSPKKTLADIYRILRPGGRLFIYCPNADSYMASFFGHHWAGFHIPFHLYHFTHGTLRKLCRTQPFEIRRFRAVTPDILLPKSLKTYLSGRNTFLKKLHEMGLFRSIPVRAFLASLFRLLDLLYGGRGECLQIELRSRERH